MTGSEVTPSLALNPVSDNTKLGGIGGLVSTAIVTAVSVEPTLPASSYQALKLKLAVPSKFGWGENKALYSLLLLPMTQADTWPAALVILGN